MVFIFFIADLYSLKKLDLVGFLHFRIATWAFAGFATMNISYINKADIKAGIKGYSSPVPFSQELTQAMDKV